MYDYPHAESASLFADLEAELDELGDRTFTGPNVESLPIDGLSYVSDFVSADEERALLVAVDQGHWNAIWQRRTQHFGRRYEGWISGERECAALPDWAQPIGRRIKTLSLFEELPNQIGINEYLPGQGIAPHIDRHCGPVASLSLGSGCVMDLVSLFGKPTISFWLAPRSLIVLRGEARSAWKHGIARRQKDVIDGRIYRRRRRVSITFRRLVDLEPIERRPGPDIDGSQPARVA